MKKYANAAIVYSFLALAGGVFYREFTKFNGFGGATSLGFVHPHYLMLGVFFFLALIVFDKLFNVSQRLGKLLVGYQVGLNLSVIMMLVRGVLQVLGTPLSSGANAAISGIAGIGHIILGVSLVMILFKIKSAVMQEGRESVSSASPLAIRSTRSWSTIP